MRASRTWLVIAAAAFVFTAPALHAQEDDWYFRRPVPSLPEQLNGVIRPGDEDNAPLRLERIRDVFALVRRCWHLVPRQLTYSGQQLTIRISFNRRGEVIGQPRITYYRAGGDRDERDVFVNSIKTTFQLCTPLPFSDSLGAAVAGRPFVFRFVDSRPPRAL